MSVFKDIAQLTQKGAKHARAEIIGSSLSAQSKELTILR